MSESLRLFTKVEKENGKKDRTKESTYDVCQIGQEILQNMQKTESKHTGKRLFSYVTEQEKEELLKRIRVEQRLQESEEVMAELSGISQHAALDMTTQGVENTGNGIVLDKLRNLAPIVERTVAPTGKKAFKFDHVNFYYDGVSQFAFDVNGNRRKIGDFALNIVQERIIIDEIVNEANEVIGKYKTSMWTVEILSNGQTFRGMVPNEKLHQFGWIQKIANHRVLFDDTAENKRLLKMYLQQQIAAQKYQRTEEYTSSGWKTLDDGTEVYLTAEGAIGHTDLSVKANPQFCLLRSDTKNRQEVFQKFLTMRDIISGHPENAVFLQYYLLVSTMTALFKEAGYQIEFCVAAIGKTNTRKTTCAEVFTRVFNRTPSAVPDINFSATDASVYEVMDKYADQVILIDDLTPAENDVDAREKRKKLELIIRSYGDRVPRKRSVSYAQNSLAKEFVPITGCALLTGETFAGGKSSRSRVIILRFEDGDVNTDILTYYQKNLTALPDFVYIFLEYVTSNLKRVKETIATVCNEIRRTNPYELKTPRYVDAMGVIYAATNILYSFIVENRFMNQAQAEILIASDREQLARVIIENDSELSVVSPAVTILEALRHALFTGKIVEKEKDEVAKEEAQNYCLSDEMFFYITSERLWECVKIYTDYRRIYFPYKAGRDLIEPLKNEDLLYIKREGATTRASHKMTIDGKVVNKRFLCLKRAVVEAVWEKLEEE